MPSGFETYKLYVDLKAHFSDNEFVFGRSESNASVASFVLRKDRYWFDKLSFRYSPIERMKDFMLANFLEKPGLYIYDLLKPEAKERYYRRMKYVDSLSYWFTEECTEVFDWLEQTGRTLNDLFVSLAGEQPIIVKMDQQRVISIETLVILDKIFRFMDRLEGQVTDESWAAIYRMVSKYAFLLKCDVANLRRVLKNMIDIYYPFLRPGSAG